MDGIQGLLQREYAPRQRLRGLQQLCVSEASTEGEGWPGSAPALKTCGTAQYQLCASPGLAQAVAKEGDLFPIPTHQGGPSPCVSREIGDLGRHRGEGVSSGSLSPL